MTGDQFYYKEFLEIVKREGYSTEHKSLNHTSPMVKMGYLHKQFTGHVITIGCEEKFILSVCGATASGVDPKDFKNNPMLYEYPHEFSVLCKDENGKEPAPETQVHIQKITKHLKQIDIDTVYYGDLSIKDGSRFKRKEERYYFKYSIVLSEWETLKIILISPDVNIARTELLMKCDLHRKVN